MTRPEVKIPKTCYMHKQNSDESDLLADKSYLPRGYQRRFRRCGYKIESHHNQTRSLFWKRGRIQAAMLKTPNYCINWKIIASAELWQHSFAKSQEVLSSQHSLWRLSSLSPKFSIECTKSNATPPSKGTLNSDNNTDAFELTWLPKKPMEVCHPGVRQKILAECNNKTISPKLRKATNGMFYKPKQTNSPGVSASWSLHPWKNSTKHQLWNYNNTKKDEKRKPTTRVGYVISHQENRRHIYKLHRPIGKLTLMWLSYMAICAPNARNLITISIFPNMIKTNSTLHFRLKYQ